MFPIIIWIQFIFHIGERVWFRVKSLRLKIVLKNLELGKPHYQNLLHLELNCIQIVRFRKKIEIILLDFCFSMLYNNKNNQKIEKNNVFNSNFCFFLICNYFIFLIFNFSKTNYSQMKELIAMLYSNHFCRLSNQRKVVGSLQKLHWEMFICWWDTDF